MNDTHTPEYRLYAPRTCTVREESQELSEEEVQELAEVAIATGLGKPAPLDGVGTAKVILKALDDHGLKVVAK